MRGGRARLVEREPFLSLGLALPALVRPGEVDNADDRPVVQHSGCLAPMCSCVQAAGHRGADVAAAPRVDRDRAAVGARDIAGAVLNVLAAVDDCPRPGLADGQGPHGYPPAMTAVLVVLYVLSFLLPTVGFVRLLVRAHRELNQVRKVTEERGSVAAQIRDFNAEHSDLTRAPRALRIELWWDTSLVGSGLLCGAVAGIVSVYSLAS